MTLWVERKELMDGVLVLVIELVEYHVYGGLLPCLSQLPSGSSPFMLLSAILNRDCCSSHFSSTQLSYIITRIPSKTPSWILVESIVLLISSLTSADTLSTIASANCFEGESPQFALTRMREEAQ
jgi:hypothetical protein